MIIDDVGFNEEVFKRDGKFVDLIERVMMCAT